MIKPFFVLFALVNNVVKLLEHVDRLKRSSNLKNVMTINQISTGNNHDLKNRQVDFIFCLMVQRFQS